MNLIDNILPADLSGAIFWTLFHSLWISFLVCAAIYFIFQSVGRNNPSLRYNIAVAGYGIIILLSFVMFLLEYNGISPMNYSSHLKSNYIIIPLDGGSQNSITENSNYIMDVAEWITEHSAFLVQLWLVGLILLSIKYIMGFNSIRIMKKHSQPPGLVFLKTAKQLALKLGIRRSFRIRASDLFESPFTIGWLKPMILLPVGITTSMPFAQVEAIIAHELAHLKRNDYLINLIQTFFDIIFYFNPLTRWLSNIISAEREKCCDEIAGNLIGDNVVLATALASTHESVMQPAHALSLLGDGKQLLERIKLLVNDSDEPEFSQRSGAVVLLTIIFCSLTFFAFTNFGTKPFKLSDLGTGNSALDLLQLDNSVNEITELLNGIVGTEQTTGNSDKKGIPKDKKTGEPGKTGNYNYNISERYSKSLENLGVNLSDLSKQMDMYNKYMNNSKIENDKLLLDMQNLSNLQNLDTEFDLSQFKLEMEQMNKTIKDLREKIKGQPQNAPKK
jgi:beta-lactamase regulating signal transducer with metallopeptidase domain